MRVWICTSWSFPKKEGLRLGSFLAGITQLETVTQQSEVPRVSNTFILFDNFQCLAGNQWALLSCICSCLAVTGLADLPKYWWQVSGALNIQGSHYLGPDWLLIVWFTHTHCGSTRDIIQARWLDHLVHWLEMAPPFSTFSACGGIWEDITAFTRNRIWKLSH